ncbi:MAG TPA: hypothetical protein VF388_11110 [Lacunisphaera sp.]
MIKWLLSATLVVLAVAGIWWQMNTTKIAYVNGLEAYAHMPNQEYVLEVDCYTFAWRHKHIATAWPLLGVNAPGVTSAVAELPREVDRKNLGKEFPDVRLMDVIPKGTHFRILSVRHESSRRDGIFVSYEITFLDDVERPYARTDTRPIQLPVARAGDPPKIDPAIAVPWIKR